MNKGNEIQVASHTADKRIDIFDTTVMESLEAFAERVAKSKRYSQVNTAEDAITAIIVGNEIGLSPMVSVANATKLTSTKIQAVMRGKEMGLAPAFALDNIHTIPTSNGAVTATGVHVITAMLIRAGVVLEYLEKAAPLYKYMEISTKQMLDKELVENNEKVYQIVHAGTKKDQRDMSKSQVILMTTPYTYQTTIKFTRESTGQTLVQSYSLQDATDAKLYPGTSSVTGLAIDGKGNWIENWKAMLDNRVRSIGGRIIIADILGGVYEYSEITDGMHTRDVKMDEGTTVLTDKEGNLISPKASVQSDNVEFAEPLNNLTVEDVIPNAAG